MLLQATVILSNFAIEACAYLMLCFKFLFSSSSTLTLDDMFHFSRSGNDSKLFFSFSLVFDSFAFVTSGQPCMWSSSVETSSFGCELPSLVR